MKRNKDKVSKPVETIDTLIGSGSVVKGDLEFTGMCQHKTVIVVHWY